MNKSDALLAAIDACYDAVVDPQSWQSALDQVAWAMNARACSIHTPSAMDRRLRFPASAVYREFLTEFVADGWALRDPRAVRGVPLAEQGHKVLIDQDVVTDNERRSLPEYRYLYPKYDLPEWASVPFRIKGDLWAMSLLRGKSQGAFDRADQRLLETLSPHLPRIIKLTSNLLGKTACTQFELLEALSVSALQIDGRGKVVAVNKHARSLLGQDIDVAGGRLRVLAAEGSGNLQAAIDQAIKARVASQLAALNPIVVNREHKRPLLVDVFPCVGSLQDVFGQSGAIVLLTDLTQHKRASDVRLRVVFGLTPAEARLAVLVASGLEIKTACRQLHIGLETARSQLKSLFAKTQTRRQAELALVLAAAMRIDRR